MEKNIKNMKIEKNLKSWDFDPIERILLKEFEQKYSELWEKYILILDYVQFSNDSFSNFLQKVGNSDDYFSMKKPLIAIRDEFKKYGDETDLSETVHSSEFDSEDFPIPPPSCYWEDIII